jgi:hypothetical protein
MAADDLVEAGFQSCPIQVAAKPHKTGNVVKIAVRIELMDEPEPLLGIRKRKIMAGLDPPQNWRCTGFAPLPFQQRAFCRAETCQLFF